MGIGERLQTLLDMRGWTHGMLASRSGVSRNYISKIIKGTRKDPGLSIMAALAQALDVSLDWLAGLPPRNPDALDPDEAQLVDCYRRIASEYQYLALDHVCKMADAFGDSTGQ